MKDIRVNIHQLNIDFMVSKHLLILNRHLPFGMLITRLLKQLKFDLSAERSIKLSVDINNTLLKRMHARECAPAPQPPLIIPAVTPGSSLASSASVDPYAALSAQLREYDLKMTTHFERIEQGV